MNVGFPGDEIVPPAPCPRCGNAARLFTPNARRDPYLEPAIYEPAWQCTRCGDLEFLGDGSGETQALRRRPKR